MKIIGIAGKIASGKTTTAYIIAKHSKKPYRISISDVLRDLLVDNTSLYDTKISIEWSNKKFERQNLIKFGKIIKDRYGDGILMQLAIEKGRNLEKKEGYDTLIVDGVRSLGEVEVLKKENGTLFYIETDLEIRFKRLKERNDRKDENIKTLEDMIHFDEIEEQLYKISKIKEKADYVIGNNGTITELERKIVEILSQIQ